MNSIQLFKVAIAFIVLELKCLTRITDNPKIILVKFVEIPNCDLGGGVV